MPRQQGAGPRNRSGWAFVTDDEAMTELSDRLDMTVDLSFEYAISTLAAGERLQPFASYEVAGEVTRAFFLGIADPDPVVEARQWVAGVDDLAYAVVVYPGELTYVGDRRQPAVLAEAWEPGMAETLVVAQEYERLPDADPELGEPAARAVGMQLEVGKAAPLRLPGGREG
jgi:hypothetical protein